MRKDLQLRDPIFRYGFALIMVIASFLLRSAMTPFLGIGYQHIFVYPAIILVAIFGGIGPAVVTGILGSLMSEYYFSPGVALTDIPTTSIIILTSLLAGWLADRLHKALAQSRQRSEILVESEEKFRLLAENANAVIGIIQGKNFVYVNPYLEQASGYSRDELLEIDIAKMLHPDYRQMVMERAAKRQMGEDVESKYQFIMITKSGQQRWMDFCAARIMYRGKPAIVGIALDITEAKQAENALRESEEKFRMLAENAGAIIGIMQDEKIIYANPYSQRASGYSLDELLEIDVKKLIHPDYQQAMLERAQRRQLGEPIESHYEFVMVTKNGESRWLDFSPILITYHGKPAIVAIAIDITERKWAEANLVSIKEQLENKNKELETIIGIVSHDLRAPLVNVKGFAGEISKDISLVHKRLQQEPSGENTLKDLAPIFDNLTQSVHFITSSAEAMDNLAASLVSVARVGLETISPESVDMNELIRKVVSSIKFKLKQNDVSYDIDANLPQCFGDKTQITQIFTNLLDNAVKYLDPNRPGQICLGCDIQADHAMYWVSDNGIGISSHDQEKIFDPYYQLHEKAAEGVGMGLATVKRMVDRNNGKIWVYSEKGKGATFYIALPISHNP